MRYAGIFFLCTKDKSMKQWEELESTNVQRRVLGIDSEVRSIVRELGLERADMLRQASVAQLEST